MEKQLDKQNGLKSHMELSIANLEADVEEKQVNCGYRISKPAIMQLREVVSQSFSTILAILRMCQYLDPQSSGER